LRSACHRIFLGSTSLRWARNALQFARNLVFETITTQWPAAVHRVSDLAQNRLAQFILKQIAITKLPFVRRVAQALVQQVRRHDTIFNPKRMKSVT
jgi:CRP-like cAMP-binding protein